MFMYNGHREAAISTQQIEFKTMQGCETAAQGVRGKVYVRNAFCVQTDK